MLDLRHRRIVNFDEAQNRYGEEFRKLARAIGEGDPLADQGAADLWEIPVKGQMEMIDSALQSARDQTVPRSLHRLVESIRDTPQWVDFEQVNRGASLILRSGLLGGITLGAKSLIEGYCAPAGNKPLVFSGQLQKRTAMRLTETARFVEAVASPEELRPHGDGEEITLKVRLMHARVRGLLSADDRWRDDLWGLPINQHDMAATIHLFSTVFLAGIQFLGLQVSPQEEEDFFHLWRYVGFLIGVNEGLLPRSAREFRRQWEIFELTQAPPDEDSKELTLALLEGPLRAAKTDEERRRLKRHTEWAKGVSRALIGKELADHLGLPENRWTKIAPLLGRSLRSIGAIRRAPFVDPWLESRGRSYWAQVIKEGPGTPQFLLPQGLGR